MTEPITMYSIRHWRAKIEPVQVARLTAKTVCVVRDDGSHYREHLCTTHGGFYHTWEEAHAALLAQAERDLTTARLRLHQAQGKVGNIKGMTKP